MNNLLPKKRPALAAAFLACQITGLFCIDAGSAPSAKAEPTERLEPVEIQATPFSNGALNTPAMDVFLDTQTLRDAPQRSLDGVLRSVPGFRLFRRTDSTTAHPTTQGVSLGNVGPNGASRSLVLLDGVPMNDPFGGWLAWNRFPPSSLAGVRLVPQAGVSPWGTASLGGVIALDSRFLNDAPFVTLEAAAGDRLRHQSALSFAQDTHSGSTRLFGGLQETDFAGYPVVRSDRRGAVDVRASSRTQSFDAGVRQTLGPDHEWHLTLRTQGWQETRNNGTPLTANTGDALDFSLRLSREADPANWATESILFTQQRRFESLFSSVSPNRDSEKPSLDQYAVPSDAFGFIQRLRLPLGGRHILGTGLDFRTTSGVTKERFRYMGNAFTQEREAGGRQRDAGVYLQDTWTPSPRWQFHGGARIDWHDDSDGHLQEWDMRSRARGRELAYQRRETTTPHFILSSKWTPNNRVEWSAATYSGARNPTLNELYRPFRAGDQVTLANPDLKKESLLGGELGFRLTPGEAWQCHLRAFENQLHNAIANLNEVQGPGTIGDWGYLPAGGVGARRENIERAEIRGLEAGLEYKLGKSLTASLGWLGSHTNVRHCSRQPALEGRSLPQVPTHQVHLGIRGEYDLWRWNIDGRWVSRQFDDDANQLTLNASATLDLRVTRKLGPKTELSAALENVTDTEIQTRRDANGTVYTGTPRMWTVGVRREF